MGKDFVISRMHALQATQVGLKSLFDPVNAFTSYSLLAPRAIQLRKSLAMATYIKDGHSPSLLSFCKPALLQQTSRTLFLL
jgi:hypothetical protein